MKRARGFTLIEVLLAATVLALALSILLGILSRGLRDVGDAGRQGDAVLVLQGLLDNAGRTQRLQAGETRGSDPQRRFQWRLAVRPATSPWPPPPEDAARTAPAPLEGQGITAQLWQIDGEVRWGEGATERVQASTLRAYYPLPGDAGGTP